MNSGETSQLPLDRGTVVSYNICNRSLAGSGGTDVNSKSTKDRILDSALTLFADKGYDGVGVDLIAENAGLKGPSLYKHFGGKEAILDALIGKVEDYYEMHFGSELQPGIIPSSMSELTDISLARIRFTLHDETIVKTRRILTMEQFRSRRIARLATLHGMDGIQGLYRKIFEGMIEGGIVRQEDPGLLSVEFTSPITLLIQLCDREPERESEAMERIEAHMRHFASVYGA